MDAMRRLIDPDDWQIAAACRNRQDLFFAPDDVNETKMDRRRREARAKTICASCTVRAECLTEALRSKERFGIWGGLTDRERRAAINRGQLPRVVPPQGSGGPDRLVRLPAIVVRGRRLLAE